MDQNYEAVAKHTATAAEWGWFGSACLRNEPRHQSVATRPGRQSRVISEDLDRQLNGIMASQGLNYTTINTTGLPYNATTKFNPKGMGQLYNVTNTFIDWVQTKQAYPEGK